MICFGGWWCDETRREMWCGDDGCWMVTGRGFGRGWGWEREKMAGDSGRFCIGLILSLF